MREREIVEEKKAPDFWDDADRRIMQALADELSEVTVSEALRERTLAAAKKQTGRRKSGGYRVFYGMFAAAAGLAVVVGVWGSLQNGRKREGGSPDAALSGNATNHVQMAEGNAGEEFFDLDSMAPNNAPGDSGSAWGMEDAFLGEAGCDGNSDINGFPMEQGPQVEPDQEWLYLELLALFDEEPFGGEVIADGGAPEDAATTEEEEVRRISWQKEGKELSCVVNLAEHRVVATLLEGGRMRRLKLDDWVYTDILWELAENGD